MDNRSRGAACRDAGGGAITKEREWQIGSGGATAAGWRGHWPSSTTVVRRTDLVAAGISRHEIRAEIERGAWHAAGVRTLCITGLAPTGAGLLWRAVWEAGSRGVLDGAAALVACGLEHWQPTVIDVSVPNKAAVRPLGGVRHHRLRDIGPCLTAGLPRTRPEVAVIRAAQWAATDRQAATIVAMSVQQRLVWTSALLDRWSGIRYSSRRSSLDDIVRAVCDGAHSLNELDIARLCRRRGLPAPTHQSVRTGRRGNVYLDVSWAELDVHAEIQGAHHYWGMTGIDDAVRFNDLVTRDASAIILQIPVLGLRLRPEVFLDQIEAALARARRRST